MSRTRIEIEIKNKNQVSHVIEEILNSHKYDPNEKNGEKYWQQGIGISESPKFIRYYFEGNKVILEGWVKNFGKESELKGVVGSLPKRSCKKVIDEIADSVKQTNETSNTFTEDEKIQSEVNQNEDLTDALFDYLKHNRTSNTSPNKVSEVSDNNDSKKTASSGKVNSQKTDGHDNSSKGIIPRKYRGSTYQNVIEILIAIFYMFGALSGRLVLRFTDSSELLLIVALIMLIHGFLSLISNIQDN